MPRTITLRARARSRILMGKQPGGRVTFYSLLELFFYVHLLAFAPAPAIY